MEVFAAQYVPPGGELLREELAVVVPGGSNRVRLSGMAHVPVPALLRAAKDNGVACRVTAPAGGDAVEQLVVHYGNEGYLPLEMEMEYPPLEHDEFDEHSPLHATVAPDEPAPPYSKACPASQATAPWVPVRAVTDVPQDIANMESLLNFVCTRHPGVNDTAVRIVRYGTVFALAVAVKGPMDLAFLEAVQRKCRNVPVHVTGYGLKLTVRAFSERRGTPYRALVRSKRAAAEQIHGDVGRVRVE